MLVIEFLQNNINHYVLSFTPKCLTFFQYRLWLPHTIFNEIKWLGFYDLICHSIH